MTTDKKKPIRREDHPGHLDPAYVASLRAKSAESNPHDDDKAFIGKHRTKDGFAEELAEGAVTAMTSGEDNLANELDEPVEEEAGGPFVTTSARQELKHGVDASNPKDATREPFPKT